MAKRVVLGRYGDGSNDYGLRVSKDGEDVVEACFDALKRWRIKKKRAKAMRKRKAFGLK